MSGMSCIDCEHWKQLADSRNKQAIEAERAAYDCLKQLRANQAQREHDQENMPPFIQEMINYFLDQQRTIENLERRLSDHIMDSHYTGD